MTTGAEHLMHQSINLLKEHMHRTVRREYSSRPLAHRTPQPRHCIGVWLLTLWLITLRSYVAAGAIHAQPGAAHGGQLAASAYAPGHSVAATQSEMAMSQAQLGSQP